MDYRFISNLCVLRELCVMNFLAVDLYFGDMDLFLWTSGA